MLVTFDRDSLHARSFLTNYICIKAIGYQICGRLKIEKVRS